MCYCTVVTSRAVSSFNPLLTTLLAMTPGMGLLFAYGGLLEVLSAEESNLPSEAHYMAVTAKVMDSFLMAVSYIAQAS